MAFDKLVSKNVLTKERDERHFKNHSVASSSHTGFKGLPALPGQGFEDITKL